MEREGNTAEQPQAPDSVATPNAAQDKAPTAEQTTSSVAQEVQTIEQPITDSASSVVVDDAPKQRRTQDKKRSIVVACLVAVVAIAIVGLIIFAIIQTNNSVNNKTTYNPDATTSEVEAEAKQLAESDIHGMIDYINNVIAVYGEGSGYQSLSQQDVGNLATTGVNEILRYIGDNLDQREDFNDSLVLYSHTADDMLKTADSALKVFFVEYYYGNRETAEQYKQTAIERGTNAFDNGTGGVG